MGFDTHVIAGGGRTSKTTIYGGSFVTAGASQPTVQGGDAILVTREVTFGALIFFRVTVREGNSWAMSDPQNAVTLTADVGTSEVLVAHVSKASLTIDGGAVANGRTEFDVVVRNAAHVAIDTAGISINFIAVVSG